MVHEKMTKEKIEKWFRSYFPTTIINDRYGGSYSNGGWLAFPLEPHEVPIDVYGSDLACIMFWDEYTEPYGLGETPQGAFDDLTQKLKAVMDGNK